MTNSIIINDLEDPADKPDYFVCGSCAETYYSLVEFITHKLNHNSPSEIYKCCLCSETWSDVLELHNHYKLHHQVCDVSLAEHDLLSTIVSSSSIPVIDYVESNSEISVSPLKNSATAMQENVLLFDNKPLENVTSEGIIHVDIIHNTEQGINQSSKDVDFADFDFILETEYIRGKTLDYQRLALKCLHCDFQTYSREALCKHMEERRHPHLIGMQQALLTEENSGQVVMSMSDYTLRCALNSSSAQLKKSGQNGKRRAQKCVSKINSFPCETCGKVFSCLRYLQKHVVLHEPLGSFICDTCGKEFKTKHYLQVHRRRHKDKMYICSQCDFRSNVKAWVLAHRQIHSEGSVLCEICGYAYTDRQTLIKHMAVHDPNRPYGCTFPGCSWRFKTEVMCNAHTRKHTVEGKFKCVACGYAFRRKHHLQRHERVTHGISVTQSCPPWKRRQKSSAPLSEDVASAVQSLTVESPKLGVEPSEHILLEMDTENMPISYITTELDDGPLSPYKVLLTNFDTHTIVLPHEDEGEDVKIGEIESELVETLDLVNKCDDGVQVDIPSLLEVDKVDMCDKTIL